MRKPRLTAITIALLMFSCSTAFADTDAPVVEVTEVPHRDEGGEGNRELIRGKAMHADPKTQVIVIYSWAGETWWVQPFTSSPRTEIGESGNWEAHIHLGEKYAVLLADRSYEPAAKRSALPPLGNDVIAIQVVPGRTKAPPVQRDGAPSIVVTKVAKLGGGSIDTDTLAGYVSNAAKGHRIVIYSLTNQWWVQPTKAHPFTSIDSEGRWSANIHLGREYAVLLVGPDFEPRAETTILPEVGDQVVAITRVSARE